MMQDHLNTQVENLLSEDIASAKQREATSFDTLTSPFQNRMVLFGAGGIGKTTLAGLCGLGLEPLAFTDSNPDLWGKNINGLYVLPPSEAVERYGDNASFVVTIWSGQGSDTMGQRVQQLYTLGCARVVPFAFLFWKYPSVFLPHYGMDLAHKTLQQAEDVRKAFLLFEDDASRHEYLAQLRWRLLLDFDALPPPVSHEIYFPQDLVALTYNECLVDLGAYDGDTIRSFLQLTESKFAQIVAFEPDPQNYSHLSEYRAALPEATQQKIRLHDLAAGAQDEKVSFSATGTGASSIGTGMIEVTCVALDAFLADTNPTYMKLDIEGAEIDALCGARQLIRKNRPVTAVCVYHCQDHLWKVPLLLNELSDEYRFFLRPHLLEVWDLVCYAIPARRLRNP